MSRSRLAMARWAGRVLPPILSNRLAIHHLYPYEFARRQGGQFRRRAITGSPFTGDFDDAAAYVFSMLGYFDWRVTAVAGAVLRPGDIALDVGANVGTETIALADLVGPTGRVYAIEALPGNLRQLERLNTESHLDQVTILPIAVAETEGSLSFAVPADASVSGIGHILAPGEDSPSITVDCKTLDGLFGAIGPIRFVTMDIEGAELDAIRGGEAVFRRDRPVMVLEACEPHVLRFGYNLTVLRDHLVGLGYRVLQVGKLGLSDVVLGSGDQHNWVAIPEGPEADALAARIGRRLFACGVLPGLPGLNPLTRAPSA